MRYISFTLFGTSLLITLTPAFASEGDDFNTDFIVGKYNQTAISKALDEGLNQSAIYAVDVNGQFVGNFYFSRKMQDLVFTKDFLETLAPLVKKERLEELQKNLSLDATSEDYKFQENTSESSLAIWFNDQDMVRADSSNMELAQSINAAMMSYNMSSSYYRNRKTGESQTTLPFSSHLQLGMYDFPINLDLSSSDVLKEGVSVDNLSVSHLLPSINSEVTAGQTYTSSRYGEGFSFIGAQLNHVNELLSRRERLYTPSITGFANSNATVEVYQEQRLLYTKTVAAGKFVIDEVQGLSNQTLRVVVKESNGSEHTFYYENTIVPGLLTPGINDYEVSSGRYRFNDNSMGDNFVSGEYSHGFEYWTPTISSIVSTDYKNITLGAAVPLQHIGAVGLAVANSKFKHNDKEDTGQSYSINYAKYMTNGVNIQLAGYRYSTRDYYTFNEAMEAKRSDSQNHSSVRNRFTATVMAQEPIFDNQISVNFLRDSYWANKGKRNTYSVNYGGYTHGVSYNVSLSKSYTDDYKPDTSLALSIDIPFGNNGKSVYTRYNQNNNSNNTEVGMNSYDADSSYSVAASHDSGSHENTLSGSYSKHTDRINSQISSSVGTSSMYASGSVSGTVAFADGHFVTSSSQSSTMALVKMDGVEGAMVNGIQTQSNGYALVPLNDSFDAQDVSVDTSSLQNNIMLDKSQIKIRPKRGSVVKMDFSAKRVKYVRAVLLDPQGKEMGFGSQISTDDGQEYYLGNGGGLLLQLAIKSPKELKNMVFISSDTGCSYTLPVGVLKKNFQEDFINAGELTCSRN
ncbi:fimbria/pilus outer membrane usher protein [Buttiauxella sp. A111]|uniref:fimbria/pilus outer membrane usher protein n=1 Tax=Buttiauxella sp. A111 TaxID=2563088 RepID=UPI0010E71685|nr:fimbria/pilus outer membrane usher protein [Buttiauxella sp. A111]GDX07869.1 fimbrial biogenesis outer membrane usher protein [Buttiauxella sp. A111]